MVGRILSIESSTFCGSIAIAEQHRVHSEYMFNLRADGGRRMAPAIKDMLEALSLKMGDLSAIAVSTGPGSFTGLRIGLSTAKALATANDIPLYAVNTLLLLAYNARLSPFAVCPLLDARRGEVYGAIYRFRKDRFEEETKPAVFDPVRLKTRLPDPVILLGGGAARYRGILEGEVGNSRWFAPPSLSLPRASHLASIVHTGMVEESVEDAMGLEPLYLRRPEAEVKWRAKQGPMDSM